jgi:hypothetical protein
MNHWTKNLPEYGGMDYASQIDEQHARVAAALRVIESARAAVDRIESEAIRFVSEHWTTDEIVAAKMEWAAQGGTPAEAAIAAMDERH